MKFWQRVKLAFSNNSMSEYVRAFLSGEDISTGNSIGNIDSDAAMKYTAVFACIRVLSETLAAMPVMVYKKDKNSDRKAVNDIGIYDILHDKPNDEMSPFNFKESCMIALNLGGNSVCEKLINSKGEVIGLYPYRWQQVQIERDKETKKLIYIISNGSEKKVLNRDQVFHVPGLSYDGVIGLSPIEYVNSAVQLGLSYEKFGVNFYKNGANAGGILSFPNQLGDIAYERLKKDFAKNYQGLANTGKPIILEEGGDFKQLTIKPADAQLIENKKFQLEDIARIYRVPLHLIQNLDRATNNNIEHQSLEFVMYTMLPWFNRWEENINMQLLSSQERKAGYYVEFKIDSLLRGDAQSRAQAYATGRQWGWLSVNDIRKLENMNPIPNGDIYLEPLNMGEAGKAKDNINAMAEKIYKMIIERGD